MQQKSREQQAYEIIKHTILTGGLKKGEVLPQAHLATHLKMNCTLIRQALSRLAGKGYVLSYTKSGMFVSYEEPLFYDVLTKKELL